MKKVFLTLMVALGVSAIALGISATSLYQSQTLVPALLENYNRTMSIYDSNDKLIEDELNHRSARLGQLQEYTPNAFIAVEDKNFYSHGGVSWGRIAKAAFGNMKAAKAKEGASTISQQLIKNTHLSHEKTMKRKLREAVLAHKLEKKYDKNQILEMYLNVVYFGNGVYGLENAANFYFSKPASELGLRESCGLAGLLRSPGRYCPLNHEQRFIERADFVMSLMLAQGLVTGTEFAEAKKTDLVITAERRPRENARAYKIAASREASAILDLSTTDLVAYGYRVFTYYDGVTQALLADTVLADDYRMRTVSGGAADVVAVVADIDGSVRGFYASTPTMVGARRNFASALKPLVVYAPAFEMGVVSPATLIDDEPFVAGEFAPKNYDNRHRGPVSVRECIKHSHNVPAVKVLEYVGMERSIAIARGLGLRDLRDENMSLALGNASAGVSFEELLKGYCIIANGGRDAQISFVRKIEDRNGRVVYCRSESSTTGDYQYPPVAFESPLPKEQIIGSDTSFLVTSCLIDAAREGTSKKLRGLPFSVAAKTGTAERGNGFDTNTDAVCVAYTPQNVLVVWQGNASMSPEHDLPRGGTGGGVTAFAVRDILNSLGCGGTFEVPESIEEIEFAGELKEWVAKRHKTLAMQNSFSRVAAVTLDGRISDSGVPAIWFWAVPYQTYEIYKVDMEGEQLLEVVREQSGEYVFFDKNARRGSRPEYYVVSRLMENSATSDAIKIYVDDEVNFDARIVAGKKVNSGKNWFF